MNARGALLSSAVLAAALAVAPRASADEKAERLFREGRALFDAGSYEQACAKFAESQSAEPSAGTALNLGDCYEKIGRVSSAFAAYKEAAVGAALRKRHDWEQFALARIAALEGAVPAVTIRVPRSGVDGLVVTRDGEPLAAKDGQIEDHPDPGPHVIEARAPGRVPWAHRIEVKLAATYVIDVPPLAEERPAEKLTAPPPRASTDDGSTWQRPVGLAIAGVGAAAAIFGAVAGFVAIDTKDQAASQCPSYPTACTSEGTRTNDRAQTWATISTVSLVAGGVMLAGGAVLFFTASPTRSSASVGITRSF